MDNINWNDVLFTLQILIAIGAGGHLKFCAILLIIEAAVVMFIICPLFIFWCINAIFGGEVAFIAALLVFAFIAYYFYSERQLKKKFKDLYGR